MSAPWATLAALALLQSVAPPPVPSESPSGVLTGLVLDDETGSPIPDANVYAIGPPTRRLTTTRSRLGGRWSLRDLPQGVYRIIALAPGFAPAWVRQGRSSRPSEGAVSLEHGIPLDPGRPVGDLVARLMRAGSISGRVTNGAGVAVPDLVVTIDGAPRMGSPRVGQALTDGDGRYRLDAVAVGERVVVVLPNYMPSNRPPDRGWSWFFHPGTTRRSEALSVTVRAGEHVDDIDIVVSLPSAHIVTGELVVPAGTGDVQVRLVSSGGHKLRTLSYQSGKGAIGPDIVEGGRYLVWARGRDGESALAAWQVLNIAGDGELPSMALGPTGTVRGRILSASGGLAPPGHLAVGSVLWIDGGGFDLIGERESLVSADGTFELSDILGPRRLYVRGLPAGWVVVDIRVAGTSTFTSGLDVGPAQTIAGVEIIIGPDR